MAALTWLPTTLMPEVGHLWATDDTTECHRHGTPTSTGQMTGRCLACIQAYGEDVALAHSELRWLTRPTAPLRHAFWPDALTGDSALPVCRFRLGTRCLYESDTVIRCPKCVQTLRAGPDHDHQI